MQKNDTAGGLVDKDQFFDLAEKIKLNPVNRIDKIDSNSMIVLTRYKIQRRSQLLSMVTETLQYYLFELLENLVKKLPTFT